MKFANYVYMALLNSICVVTPQLSQEGADAHGEWFAVVS